METGGGNQSSTSTDTASLLGDYATPQRPAAARWHKEGVAIHCVQGKQLCAEAAPKEPSSSGWCSSDRLPPSHMLAHPQPQSVACAFAQVRVHAMGPAHLARSVTCKLAPNLYASISHVGWH